MEKILRVSTLPQIVGKNLKGIIKAEYISEIVFLAGIIAYGFNLPFSNFLFTIGAFSTAFMLFLQAFTSFANNHMDPSDDFSSLACVNFVYKVYFISIGISTLSIYGMLLEKPFADTALFFIGIVLFLITGFTIKESFPEKSKVYHFKFYIRIFIGLAFWFYSMVVHII